MKKKALLRTESGQALVGVLGIALVLGMGVAALYSFLPGLQKERMKSRDLLEINTVLSSAVEYMRYAIREQWVLTDTGARDNGANISTVERFVTHPRNTARLLLSEMALTTPGNGFNAQLGRTRNDRSALLGSVSSGQDPFRIDVNLDDVTNQHPLKVVLDLLRRHDGIKGIRFTVERVDNVHYPHGGRGAVFLKIRAELWKRSGLEVIMGRSGTFFAEGVYGYFPREVNSFALIVGGDMRLDQSTPLGGRTDFTIPLLNRRDRLDNSVSNPYRLTGVLFQSPVFVNRDLILKAKATDPNDQKWNPTTFGDSITLGYGKLKVNKDGQITEYTPNSAGGPEEALYASLQDRFGGFRRGLARDGYPDKGLKALFNIDNDVGVPSNIDMRVCIREAKVVADLRSTQPSMLVIKKERDAEVTPEPAVGKYHYRLALTHKNFFAPQGRGGKTTGVLSTDQERDDDGMRFASGGAPTVTTDPGNAPPVMKLSVKLFRDGMSLSSVSPAVVAEMGFNSTLKFRLTKPDLSALREAVDRAGRDLNQKREAKRDAEAELEELQRRLPELEANYERVKEEYDAALEPRSDDLRRRYDRARRDFNEAKDKVETRLPERIRTLTETEIPAAEESKRRAEYNLTQADREPEIEIKTRPVVNEGNEQPDQLKLSVEVTHENVLASPDLKNLRMAVYVEAYEVGSDGAGGTLRDGGTRMVSNHTRIRFDRSGDRLQAPSSIGSRWVTANPSGEPGGGVDLSAVPGDEDRTRDQRGCAEPYAPPDFAANYAKEAPIAWNFNPPAGSNLILDDRNSTRVPVADPVNWEFPKISIAENCIIRPQATFVTGFFVCRNLTIEPRSQPLRIIGTFVVGRASISESAAAMGIVWSSIYHPTAILEMRASNRLGLGNDCGRLGRVETALLLPIWHPEPSLTDLSTLYACMPSALRGQYPEPFTWTQIEPACIPNTAGTGMTCSYLDKRFNVLTMSFVNNI